MLTQKEKYLKERTDEWVNKGHAILNEKYWSYWEEIVPIRLTNLYHGIELGQCLDIVKPLNDGCALEEAKKIITDQDHSGHSWKVVVNMVKTFCDRGEEFVNYVKD